MLQIGSIDGTCGRLLVEGGRYARFAASRSTETPIVRWVSSPALRFPLARRSKGQVYAIVVRDADRVGHEVDKESSSRRSGLCEPHRANRKPTTTPVTITGSYGLKVFEQRFALNLQGRETVWRALAQRGRFCSK